MFTQRDVLKSTPAVAAAAASLPNLAQYACPKSGLETGYSVSMLYISTKSLLKCSTQLLPPLPSTKVCDQLRERICYFHYSIRTEDTYFYWVRTFILFHKLLHPLSMDTADALI